MDAIIICGGLGTRVREITRDEYPKILIEVAGRRFINHLRSSLYDFGIRNITYSAGFQGNVLRDYVDKHYKRDLVLVEEAPLGTGGAVMNALQHGNIHSDPFLVVNGDCLITDDGLYDNLEHRYYSETWGADCAMFTCQTQNDGRYGTLGFSKYNPFSAGMSFIEKFENGKPGESWINCGWYIMKKSIFENISMKVFSLEKYFFPNYIGEQEPIPAMIVDDKQFIEIGTPEAIARAERFLNEQRFQVQKIRN